MFLWHWKTLTGDSGRTWVAEHRFHAKRGWRFDFAHLRSQVAVECDGATFVQGRHTRGAGYERDCEKLNEAAAHGWRVFRLTRQMLEKDPARWVAMIREAIAK